MHRRRKLIRFLLLGGANTLLTYLVLAALLTVAPPAAAYGTAFALGVLFNTLAVGPVVFGTHPSLSGRLSYAAWLIATFGCGLVAVQCAARANFSPFLLAAVPPCVTTPLGFIGGRIFLARDIVPADIEEAL